MIRTWSLRFIVCAILSAWTMATVNAEPHYRVTAESLNVRTQPSLNARSIGTLSGGHTLPKGEIVQGEGRSWLKVSLTNGVSGWTSMKYVEPLENYRVTAYSLSVRSEPKITAERVGILRADQIVPYGENRLELMEGSPPRRWMKVSSPVQGWVSTKFLVPVASNSSAETPPWLKAAFQELGVTELSGSQHNKRILEYHSTVSGSAKDDETPWCSSFVNWCVEKDKKIEGTRLANARSWQSWGDELEKPKRGCIVVFWRVKRHSWQGHVGFFLEETSDGRIKVLGGNQASRPGAKSDRVSIMKFSKSRVLGYRWPAPHD